MCFSTREHILSIFIGVEYILNNWLMDANDLAPNASTQLRISINKAVATTTKKQNNAQIRALRDPSTCIKVRHHPPIRGELGKTNRLG